MEKPEAAPVPPPAESKFTQRNRDGILGAIVGGTPIEFAAALVGVRKKTVEDWIYRGMVDADNGVESEYADFAMKVQQALAMPVAEAAQTVTRAIKRGDVQTAMKFLERRAPTDYGRTDKVEHIGQGAQPVVIELSWPTGGMHQEHPAIDAASEEIIDADIVDDGS